MSKSMISKVFTNKSGFAKPLLVVALSVVLFFTLRLLFLTKIPVFVDEAIYIRWSQIMRNEPSLRFLPLSDGKQPLFMWLTMPSLKIFSDPLIAGRTISIFSGFSAMIGLCILIYLLSGNLYLSSLGALTYAILPFTVFFDRMSLADSLLNSFGIWSLVFGVGLTKSPRLDTSLFLGFSIGLGLLTKSPAVFFYLWQPLILLYYFDFSAKGWKTKFVKILSLWIVAIVISQSIASIMRLGANFHMIGSRNADYLFSFSEVLNHPANPLTGNSIQTVRWLWYLFTPPLFVALIASVFSKYKRQSLLILSISILVLLSQGLIAKVYTSRYILFASIPLVFNIVVGCDFLFSKFKSYKYLLAIVMIVWPAILSFTIISNPTKAGLPHDMRSGYLEEWTAGWGQTQVADYLIKLSQTGQRIVVVTDGFFGSLPDGLQIYTQSYPNITVIGGPPGIKTLPESLVNSLKDPKNAVFLVANASRLSLPESERNRLKEIARYDKPDRKDGTHESLLIFQLIQ